jgi:hypothetical protein
MDEAGGRAERRRSTQALRSVTSTVALLEMTRSSTTHAPGFLSRLSYKFIDDKMEQAFWEHEVCWRLASRAPCVPWAVR